jgi:hypothetical protein
MKSNSNADVHVGNTLIAIVGTISIVFMIMDMYSGSIDKAEMWSFITVASWCVFFGRNGWDNSETKVRVEVETESEDLWMQDYQAYCQVNKIHYDHPYCPCVECRHVPSRPIETYKDVRFIDSPFHPLYSSKETNNLPEEELPSTKVIIS